MRASGRIQPFTPVEQVAALKKATEPRPAMVDGQHQADLQLQAFDVCGNQLRRAISDLVNVRYRRRQLVHA